MYIYTHTHYTFFIHLSVDGDLGFFCNLAIVDSAAVNIGCMCLFESVSSANGVGKTGERHAEE